MHCPEEVTDERGCLTGSEGLTFEGRNMLWVRKNNKNRFNSYRSGSCEPVFSIIASW